jgi:hypothetical protein
MKGENKTLRYCIISISRPEGKACNLETYGISPELHPHETNRLHTNIVPHTGNLTTERAAQNEGKF